MSPTFKRVSLNPGSMKESVRNRLIISAIACGPIALVIAIFGFLIAARAPEPMTYDVPAEYGQTLAAQNWAEDYVLLWLGGTGNSRGTSGDSDSPNLATLKERTAAPVELSLPQTPYAVQDIRSTGAPTRIDAGGGDYIWRVQVEAQVLAPGTSKVAKNFYAVDLFEHQGTFMAQALPRQINHIVMPFTVDTLYGQTAEPDSAVGAAAQAFASAYLVPREGAGNFGTTVGPDINVQPLGNSPYTEATLVSVLYYPVTDGFTMDNVQPDDEIKALITVKASTSATTWTLTQIPATMRVLSNGQWVVSSVDDYVDVGATRSK